MFAISKIVCTFAFAITKRLQSIPDLIFFHGFQFQLLSKKDESRRIYCRPPAPLPQ